MDGLIPTNSTRFQHGWFTTLMSS